MELEQDLYEIYKDKTFKFVMIMQKYLAVYKCVDDSDVTIIGKIDERCEMECEMTLFDLSCELMEISFHTQPNVKREEDLLVEKVKDAMIKLKHNGIIFNGYGDTAVYIHGRVLNSGEYDNNLTMSKKWINDFKGMKINSNRYYYFMAGERETMPEVQTLKQIEVGVRSYIFSVGDDEERKWM